MKSLLPKNSLKGSPDKPPRGLDPVMKNILIKPKKVRPPKSTAKLIADKPNFK